MSLQVQHLTRLYGDQKAVDDISFTVKKGEIVGFLGPNGAGKSTTMKMITGGLCSSAGRVLINDLDVARRPMDVKKITGYLPEHNPLYLDMYVFEYLWFVGGLYGLGKTVRTARINEVIQQCGIAEERGKKLGMLSKGYRQRVGLAQALIHHPEVLILDEPTSGLDPNQIVEIRKMIKSISQDKTVLFSTHIMQEAQALCDRVVVINKGKIVAEDSLQNLMQRDAYAGRWVAQFRERAPYKELCALEGVYKAERLDDGQTFHIWPQPGADIRGIVFAYAKQKQYTLLKMQEEKSAMEEVFYELTTDKAHG